MALDDPFFVVREEVQKTIDAVDTLYSRWCQLANDPKVGGQEELDWTTNELRNNLRSIEWDLEDLDETIGVVEKNPKKFNINGNEVNARHAFINKTKATVKNIKEHLSNPRQSQNGSRQPQNGTCHKEETGIRQALLSGFGSDRSKGKYTRLDNDEDNYNQKLLDDTNQRQKLMIKSQDDQLETIGSSVRVLKDMSRQIGSELDEQSVMLDDFAKEMDSTDSRLDTTMKKMAKVLHMSNDRRQWMAIGILLLVMVIVLILFFVIP